MDLYFTKKQILSLSEQDATADPAAQAPTAGTSDKQAGGQGYPEVGKWESGIERGPANQVGVTKWADVVGSKLKRGKANQLKEQSSYEKGVWDRSTKMIDKMGTSEYKHNLVSVLEFGSVFIPIAGPFISAGFGLGNAALYYNEGDEKNAGLSVLFSLLPFVNKIPGFKKIGESVFSNLVKKLSSKGGKITLTPLENDILKNIKANEGVLKSELNNKVKQMAINSLKTTKGLNPNTKKNLIGISKFGLQFGTYMGIGVGYNKIYDYYGNKKQEQELDKLIKRGADENPATADDFN